MRAMTTARGSSASRPSNASNALETRARRACRARLGRRQCPQLAAGFGQRHGRPASARSKAIRRFRIGRPSNATSTLRAAVAGGAVRNWRERGRNGEDTGSTIEDRNVRVAPGVGEAGGLVQPRGRLPRVFDPTERRVSRTPDAGNRAARSAHRGHGARPSVVALAHRLAPRPPLRLARLAPASPVALPPRLLFRSVRLGLFPLRDRLAAVAELLPQQLLAERSVAVPPAARLRAVPLGPLS